MHSMKALRVLLLCVTLSCGISVEAPAQCPMCRMAVQSNLNNGGTSGKGLNRGILYMLMMPYLLVGTIGYVWWRNKREEEEEEFGLN